jgi:hypothetical protein
MRSMSDAQFGRELEFTNQIDGPFVITFTAHLPSILGIPNDVGHIISLLHPSWIERLRRLSVNDHSCAYVYSIRR